MITAVGDVMLGRTFEKGGPAEAIDLLGPGLRELLIGDLVTGNLECLLTRAERANPHADSAFRADAERVRGLLERFHVLTLANNHVHDFLDPGIEDTLRHLADLGIAVVGVGATEEEAVRPHLRRVGERRVAVFGLATAVNITPEPSRYVVGQPGPAAYEAVRDAAAAGDLVVVHMHAGGGDFPHPAPDVRRTHERLFDAGASVVLGHHPHRIQGWTASPSRLDFYSLGDFVFDRFEGGRDVSLLVRIRGVGGGALEAEVVPVVRGGDYVVRAAAGEAKEAILREAGELGRALLSGESDGLYYSSYDPWIQVRSLLKDFRSGGVRAVLVRVRRLGLAKFVAFFRRVLGRMGARR